jgi:hypothetical protein
MLYDCECAGYAVCCAYEIAMEVTMTEVEVFSGICGFKTTIRVEGQKKYKATCIIESGCPNHKKVAKILDSTILDLMDELFKKGKSQVLNVCQGIVPHVSCPVPAAILKALEVGAGLALPADATITFIKTDVPKKMMES